MNPIAPDWMVIDAVRYALGRRTYQVAVTCGWVRDNWAWLDAAVQNCIQHDVEDAARRGALGDACDRAEWERVRALWLSTSIHNK